MTLCWMEFEAVGTWMKILETSFEVLAEWGVVFRSCQNVVFSDAELQVNMCLPVIAAAHVRGNKAM